MTSMVVNEKDAILLMTTICNLSFTSVVDVIWFHPCTFLRTLQKNCKILSLLEMKYRQIRCLQRSSNSSKPKEI